ncbi:MULTISPECIES: competence protein [Bradyrhizobium]|uniref:Competence protein n=1 Tax=Bradyrhizobium septentrionale TaxID=1404411 RepID=A0ABZ2P1N9_9BRAD
MPKVRKLRDSQVRLARIPHWAHKAIRNCDSWIEPETEWHRAWKNKFPTEWQEFIQHDGQSGEKHIADVRTEHGLVIEFQHSHLNPLEQTARERFYGNMVWVVDGTRLQRDYSRFLKNKANLRTTDYQGYFLLDFPEECFSPLWVESSAPVIFDFRGIGEDVAPDGTKDALWCLLPGRAGRYAVVVQMPREYFMLATSSQPQLLPARDIVTGFAQRLRAAQERIMQPPFFMSGRAFRRRRSWRL